MKEKLLRLLELMETNGSTTVSINDIEKFLGTQNYVYPLKDNKRIWIYEDNEDKTLAHLTIKFDCFSDNIKVLDMDVFCVGGTDFYIN